MNDTKKKLVTLLIPLPINSFLPYLVNVKFDLMLLVKDKQSTCSHASHTIRGLPQLILERLRLTLT